MPNYVVVHNETILRPSRYPEFALIPADIPPSHWRPGASFRLSLLASRVSERNTCLRKGSLVVTSLEDVLELILIPADCRL